MRWRCPSIMGKVLLIVNTETGCGFTPQYEELQNIYNDFKERGLEIFDSPCNQFGNQAPGGDTTLYHTNEPWKVLEYCATLGEIHDIVIEDMERQSRGLKG